MSADLLPAQNDALTCPHNGCDLADHSTPPAQYPVRRRDVDDAYRYDRSGDPVADDVVGTEFVPYRRTIGVEMRGVYDGIAYWVCPDCGGRWHRFLAGNAYYDRVVRALQQRDGGQ